MPIPSAWQPLSHYTPDYALCKLKLLPAADTMPHSRPPPDIPSPASCRLPQLFKNRKRFFVVCRILLFFTHIRTFFLFMHRILIFTPFIDSVCARSRNEHARTCTYSHCAIWPPYAFAGSFPFPFRLWHCHCICGCQYPASNANYGYANAVDTSLRKLAAICKHSGMQDYNIYYNIVVYPTQIQLQLKKYVRNANRIKIFMNILHIVQETLSVRPIRYLNRCFQNIYCIL